ncbi:MAG TPA: branched-chain amino acid ABC transporter permease [Thermodesulfobacteriota bacterium]|nr:branched-chain amino acid ABC transporter permease [Thermodesulfobacteriota bacterium]
MGYYELSILAFMGINILLGLSVYAILATNQLSVGNAGFMAIGAYISSFLTVQCNWPIEAALIVGALAAVLAGVIIGIPSLRLSGIYVVLATLGFGEMIRNFFNIYEPLGAAQGYRGAFGATVTLIYFWVAVAVLFLWVLSRSRLGMAFDAVKDDQLVASTIGLPVTKIKVGAFIIGSFIAGIAGGLYAHYVSYVEPPNFDFVHSTIIILFVLLGGMETLWGAILGAAIFTILPEVTRFMKEWRLALYGGIIVFLMILKPAGLIRKGDLARWFGRKVSGAEPQREKV